MENAKLCEETCQQLYHLCLEKHSDEIMCQREFYICFDFKLKTEFSKKRAFSEYIIKNRVGRDKYISFL